MDFLPIFVDIKHRDCLVVGGGEIAARKIVLLLQAKANVTVVAPSLDDTLKQQCDKEIVSYCQKDFQPEDIEGFVLYPLVESLSGNKKQFLIARKTFNQRI